MTISNEGVNSDRLAEFRSHLQNLPAQAAFDVFIDAAKLDRRYMLVPQEQGAFSRTVRYFVDDRWPYGFIVNLNDLLFHYRLPSRRANDETLVGLVALGLDASSNPRGEIKIRVRNAEDASKVLADCFGREPLLDALPGALMPGATPEDEAEAAWSDDELRASVVAYRRMQELERAGEARYKKQIYRELSERFGRTEKAFEFRMQNISAVLSLLGRDWIAGLKPAAHVGAGVASRIEGLINEVNGVVAAPAVAFEISVRERVKRKPTLTPNGVEAPVRVVVASSTFVRDAEVKAWVLHRAAGMCECCGEPSPFEMVDGNPFLEVHHLRTLADGGTDTVKNATAVCPNCHRRMHFGKDARQMRERTIGRISELVAE
jgi:5-methylcytosine-specific restriction protein A